MNLLKELNDSERVAVEYIGSPQLVIAGAGSGKTRVLTYKIAHLISLGLKPWNILALTFTNKAAKEMKERIGALVGVDASSRLQMGTFHSVFSRILRVEAEHIGYQPNFTIYDENDSRSLIKSIVKELELDDKLYKPAAVHQKISMAKNKLINEQTYANDARLTGRDASDLMPEVHTIYKMYAERCRSANSMDFDDLLMNIYQLFKTQDTIRKKYAEHFQYVLVDEYQDTNEVQQSIVYLLTKDNPRICVVGDDAQSIYGFRGANIDNILTFKTLYPNTKLFKLEQNYRSTQPIVQAANSLIKHNTKQIPKEVFSEKQGGEPLQLKVAMSDREEAAIVCKEIKAIKQEEGGGYNQFAILYRANSQSRTFEEELLKQNIPYVVYGGLSFYQRKEVKDIIAYFRVIVNADDEEALKRIINYPTRGIGNTTISKIIDCAIEHKVSLWKVLNSPLSYGLKVNSGTQTKLNNFTELIKQFTNNAQTQDAHAMAMQIVTESGITADIFSGTDVESLSRQENVNEFLSSIQLFVDERLERGEDTHILLSDYLQEVSLLTDADTKKDNVETVKLMTIHASKGLEFPTVFIVGLEENIFPSSMMVDSVRKLEEERRLFYVAITRAEKHCYLTLAHNRYRYGRMEFNPPSRFLNDLDDKLVEKSKPLEGVSIGSHQLFGRRDIQNSNPVASQFKADIKPKITSERRPEPRVNPFSDSFKERVIRSGANVTRLEKALKTKVTPNQSDNYVFNGEALKVGTVIEHQRFGRGVILNIEDVGENAKATVDFNNMGTKQLLLKFAKFKIIS